MTETDFSGLEVLKDQRQKALVAIHSLARNASQKFARISEEAREALETGEPVKWHALGEDQGATARIDVQIVRYLAAEQAIRYVLTKIGGEPAARKEKSNGKQKAVKESASDLPRTKRDRAAKAKSGKKNRRGVDD